MTSKSSERCPWCGDDALYVQYHDTEWGFPVYKDRDLWEKLVLDGFQAGLSWITILKKRENFIRAFDGFRPEIIAQYDEDKIQALLQDTGIVRNNLKVRGTVTNAKLYLEMMEEGSFSEYLWSFVGGKPIVNRLKSMDEAPATSPESDAMSKALRKRGFKFVGSTICYAFMQAVGMVNDHLITCPQWQEVQEVKP